MALPRGYKQAEYIAFTGTQYINTGFLPNQDTRLVMDVDIQSRTTVSPIFGSRHGVSSNAFYEFSIENAAGYQNGYGNSYVIHDMNTAGRHVIDKNKNELIVDGTLIHSHTYSAFACSYSIYVMSINNAGTPMNESHPVSGKVYSCQIYDNGTLVRDFVPCTTNTGKIGLYDRVNDTFHTMQGYGTFYAGVVESPILGSSIIDGVSKSLCDGYVTINGVLRPVKKTLTNIDGIWKESVKYNSVSASLARIYTWYKYNGSTFYQLRYDSNIYEQWTNADDFSVSRTFYKRLRMNGTTGKVSGDDGMSISTVAQAYKNMRTHPFVFFDPGQTYRVEVVNTKKTESASKFYMFHRTFWPKEDTRNFKLGTYVGTVTSEDSSAYTTGKLVDGYLYSTKKLVPYTIAERGYSNSSLRFSDTEMLYAYNDSCSQTYAHVANAFPLTSTTSAYCVQRITFNNPFNEAIATTIEILLNGFNYYKYMMFATVGKVDTALNLDYNQDSTYSYSSYGQGFINRIVQNVSVSIPSGQHFVDIKFAIKDFDPSSIQMTPSDTSSSN